MARKKDAWASLLREATGEQESQTGTATRESGRDVSCRVPSSPRRLMHISGNPGTQYESSRHSYTSIGPDIETRVLPC